MAVTRTSFLRDLGWRLRSILAEDDHGKAGITVLLALVTLVTTVVIALQFDASSATSLAERQADAAALRRSESDARGNGDQIVDYGLYRAWSEQIQRANWAAVRAGIIGTTDPGQSQLLAALNQTDTALAEWVRSNSPLLQPPYFDTRTFQADFIAYFADRASGSLLAGEQFATADTVAGRYESRSAAFVALLTILATALFFLGLAATILGRPRRVLIVAGLLFALVGTATSAVVAVQPIHRVGDPAIQAVVRATVEEIQGASRGTLHPTAAQRQHAIAGIAAAEEAVRLDPDYPGAWRVQGEANLGYATSEFFSSDHPDVSAYVARSIEGYDRVFQVDKQDFSIPWNLGWAKYLAGDYTGSLAATSAALKLTPDRFTLFLNRALVQLAQGDAAAAKASVETGLDTAAAAGLGSQGSFFSESDFEIGRLAELRPNEATVLREIRQRIREADVSIATTGQARTPPPAGSLSIASLSTLGIQADGAMIPVAKIAEGSTIQAKGVTGFRLQLAGKGVAGQPFVVRVRRDGLVDNGYSQLWTWSGRDTASLDLVSPYGSAGYDISGGRYEIEVYLAGHLAGALTMTVNAPAA